MEKRLSRPALWPAILIILFFAVNLCRASDIDTLTDRLKAEYAKGKGFGFRWVTTSANAETWLTGQSSNGSWTDIDYNTSTSATWPALDHLYRLESMSMAYLQPSHPAYQSLSMKEGIRLGLAIWFSGIAGSPNNDWFSIIGRQLALGPTLIMMKGILDSALIYQGSSFMVDPGAGGYDGGQNMVWTASQTIWRGCLRNSMIDLNLGLNAVKNAGWSDWSINSGSIITMHDLLYNGGYGREFVSDVTFWVVMNRGLSFAFDAYQTGRHTGLILDGNQWMVRRNTWDFAATGREISRKGPSWKSFGIDQDYLLQLPTSRSNEMRSFVSSLNGVDDSAIIGNKQFSTVDFNVHKRRNYHSSIKMCSNRILSTEALNGENIKGYYLSYGVHELMRNGNEYGAIGAVWDWARLPGVTCPRTAPVPDATIYIGVYGPKGPTAFAGGASDGRYGAVGFDLNYNGVTGRKAWFCFDDEIAALGSGINSTGSDTIATSINQCRLFGDVWAGYENGVDSILPRGLYAAINPKWVFHDSVGYVFPNQPLVTLKNEVQSGSWYSINKSYSQSIISEDVFSLWQDHGVNPVNANYQYIVLPGVDKDRVRSYAGDIPVRTISNTTAIQAVRHDRLGITGIVFYQAGQVVVRVGLSLKVDKPCIVLLDESGEKYKVVLCNADQRYAPTYLVDLIFAEVSSERLVFGFNESDSINKTRISAASVTGWTPVDGGSALSAGSEISVEPNPFNPSALISYSLPQKAVVSLTLYNPQGKVVKELVNGMVLAGRHSVRVDAGGLASGIYICEFKSKAAVKRIKLALMR